MKILKKASVLIVECESPDRELLKNYLGSRPEFELAGTVQNGSEALKILNQENIDLVFLNTEFLYISGIESLIEVEACPFFILITDHEQFAVTAFELGAFDCIQKPFSQERLDKAIDKMLLFWESDII